ncbi:hypothetical protein D8I35_01570 [Corticibacter populi]|uniref:Uncharacterized protein n=1 Tax=Corticibacter populi TaxID=1550736 RepID=A0A3M6QY91_9BURK|nr:hypothetical protein [Corticibacter populi]RMX07843.1 hypothetical protein D8I35_01570 [Corticibacter populi]
MTMVIDSKQLAKNGSTNLDPNAAGGFVQLSDESLDVVLLRLKQTPAANAIYAARAEGTLLKAVAYVDKNNNALKIVKIDI